MLFPKPKMYVLSLKTFHNLKKKKKFPTATLG